MKLKQSERIPMIPRVTHTHTHLRINSFRLVWSNPVQSLAMGNKRVFLAQRVFSALRVQTLHVTPGTAPKNFFVDTGELSACSSCMPSSPEVETPCRRPGGRCWGHQGRRALWDFCVPQAPIGIQKTKAASGVQGESGQE